MELNKIYNEDCITGLKKLPDRVIDCCVTSPPYWGLRDYGNDMQLGNEKHFLTFVENLCNVFDEVYRVLKDTGTCFVNLGDTYGTQSGSMGTGLIEPKYGHNQTRDFVQPNVNMHKCLCMVPERFAIEMINRGWILRNQIIWQKPNQMPQSSTDRFTVDFEKIFFFVKSAKYYFEQQLEPYESELDRWGGEQKRNPKNEKIDPNGLANANSLARERDMRPNKEGRNMRTVWRVNTEPNTDAHFATYPQMLISTPIKAGCPEGGVVIDPFMGAGTTAVVARKLNRNYIGYELNKEYIDISEKRIYDKIGLFL